MKYRADQLIKVVCAHSADALSATATTGPTGGIDTKGFDSALVIVNGGEAAANAESDVTVLECTDSTGTAYTHVAGSSFTQITPTAATNQLQILSINLRKRKRWLIVKNKGDNSNAVELGVTVLLLGANKLPVTQAGAGTFGTITKTGI